MTRDPQQSGKCKYCMESLRNIAGTAQKKAILIIASAGHRVILFQSAIHSAIHWDLMNHCALLGVNVKSGN